jgi:hypothetical protein
MIERRQQTRFHPGIPLSATFLAEAEPGFPALDEQIRGEVEDVSCQGFRVILPEGLSRILKPGQKLTGTLCGAGNQRNWSGRITHISSRSGRVGIGVVLEGGGRDATPLRETVEQVVQDPRTGGIHLRLAGEWRVMDIIGHLSLALSRDFLHMLRGEPLAAIDLAHCSSLDSAGLGMLCLASEAGVPIEGARGTVLELLTIARIPLRPQANREPGAHAHGKPSVRPGTGFFPCLPMPLAAGR